MADILLRERASVLQCALDAVEQVIDMLERSRQKADARLAVRSSTTEALDHMGSALCDLKAGAESAQFASGTELSFGLALASIEVCVTELDRQLKAPPMTSRVRVRLDQLVGSLTDAVTKRRDELQELVDTLSGPGGLPDE